MADKLVSNKQYKQQWKMINDAISRSYREAGKIHRKMCQRLEDMGRSHGLILLGRLRCILCSPLHTDLQSLISRVIKRSMNSKQTGFLWEIEFAIH